MPETLRSVLRGICLSIGVAGVTAAAVFIFAYLFYPVTGIRVEGAKMYPQSNVSQYVSNGASLLTLNGRMLERRVEGNPWIESAKVTKEWRSGIVLVEVKERRAVMDAVLEGQQVVMATDGTELPGLGGASLERVEVDEDQVEDILTAQRDLEEHDLALQSVDDVSAAGIEVTIEDRKILFANRLSGGQIEALPEVMRRNPKAPVFDLRSPGRIVVSDGPRTLQDAGTSG